MAWVQVLELDAEMPTAVTSGHNCRDNDNNYSVISNMTI